MSTLTATKPLAFDEKTLADADLSNTVDPPSTSATTTPNPKPKQDAYLSDSTTRAPSLSESGNENKEKAAERTSNSLKEEPLGSEQDSNEYPTGFTLVSIVIALVLSIFLVSLDMVRVIPHKTLTLMFTPDFHP